MNDDKLLGFQFKYSVPTECERKEIESIRESYKEKTLKQKNFEKLKSLDKKAKRLPRIIAYTLGIISILIFGLGMSTVMVWNMLVLGVLISIIGIIGMIVNYPIFKILSKLCRQKYGLEIIKLSNELLQFEQCE